MIIVYIFNNFQGFGDNIRGLISVKQLQKFFNFDLFIDLRSHVFKDYLLNDVSYDVNNIVVEKHFEYMYDNEICHNSTLINDLSNLTFNCISICTNTFPEINEITDEIKIFIRNILKLKPEYNIYFKEKLKNIPNEYNLFHYRFGDEHLIEKKRINLRHFYNHFISNKKLNSVVISDSFLFKKCIYTLHNNIDVYCFLNNPEHTKTMGTINNNDKLETLCDFFLIQNAKSINCYSNYRWISNFILWTSIIYNIPLYNLK